MNTIELTPDIRLEKANDYIAAQIDTLMKTNIEPDATDIVESVSKLYFPDEYEKDQLIDFLWGFYYGYLRAVKASKNTKRKRSKAA